MQNTKSDQRLASLDLLRGFDIFYLTVVCFIVGAAHRTWGLPEGLMAQFRHPSWAGFSIHDLIMPLFLFMSGAAVPLALPKRLSADGHADWPFWRHVLTRVALLWFCGLIAQGELFSFDLHRISFVNNTLQTIACGYAIAAGVILIRNRALRLAMPFLLALVYTVFLHACGDMSPTGNAAVVYEVKFLTLFYGDPSLHPVSQIANWHYTWWTTIPMFGVLALAGCEATQIVRGSWSNRAKLGVLLGVAAGLALLGLALSTFDPVVKHIFTASFTAYALACNFLLYALFFLAFDMLKWRRGTGLLRVFGRHSLAAYMSAETVLRSLYRTASAILLTGPQKSWPHGLSRFFADEKTFEFLRECVLAALLCAFLVWLDRLRTPKQNQQRRSLNESQQT